LSGVPSSRVKLLRSPLCQYNLRHLPD
jgi:hypothetical protein